jgi:DNA-binding response OmpR family regulator
MGSSRRCRGAQRWSRNRVAYVAPTVARAAGNRRADPTPREIAVIVVSSIEEMDSVVRCNELGAEEYLPTPADRVLLRARIGACLERKCMHDEIARQEDLAGAGGWNRTQEQKVTAQVAENERRN